MKALKNILKINGFKRGSKCPQQIDTSIEQYEVAGPVTRPYSSFFVFLEATILFLGMIAFANASVDDERPNIILVIADDVSWNDIGAYGHPTVRTPTLDAMASEGRMFDNAFLTASSCSPSRASIMTGRFPHNTDAEQLHWALPKDQITLTEKLREVGYWTGAAGKWHLGEEIRDRVDVLYNTELYLELEKGIDPSGAEDWLRLLDERPKNKPFFLWLGAWDAHRPFREGVIDTPHSQKDVTLPPYYPATDLYLNDFALYYDEITRLDQNVALLLKKLKEQNVADNTLVVFIADNGRPFARDKTTLYDSGVKTPFIAWWPAGIKNHGVSKAIISAVDIAPTFLEVAGAQIPPTIEGLSLLPLLKQPNDNFRQYAVSERNWHDFEDHGRSVRTEQFRYIINNYNDLPATPSADTVYHKTWDELVRLNDQGALNKQMSRPFLAPRPKEELYDLSKDPYELYNLASSPKYKQVLEEHRQLLKEWTIETNDYVPSFRTLDDFDRVTGERTPARKRPRPSKKEMYGIHGKY